VLGIEHVLFERGTVAERWKTTTWDSLRMLTPNWMNGLPWQPYDGADPHGFMTRDEVIAFLERYARRFAAPVFCRTNVVAVDAFSGRYRVVTTSGVWRARAVVIATGHCDLAFVPPAAGDLASSITSLHSSQYRAPDALPEGGVLVVGASSSGVQIADELRRAGREVVLSVGRHTRLPRSWRGHDIFWWLTRLGKQSERTRDIIDLAAAMRQPSLQLVGRPDHGNIDLASLQAIGVQLAGRLRHVDGDRLTFADDLDVTVAKADAKLLRILNEIDRFASGDVGESRPSIAMIDVGAQAPVTELALQSRGIRTIIWATGFRRAYPWLRLPVVTGDGEIDHRDGITAMPGVCALGFRLLRKRDSNFLGGVGTDAWEIGSHLARYLGLGERSAA
jgi:putative flavoprotein involved in K+ transport